VPLSVKLQRNVVVMGVSGSGKTTIGERLANAFDAPFLEGDSLHSAANVAKMAAGTPLDDADRLPWLEAIAARLAEGDDGPSGMVATCSSLKRSYRDILRGASKRRTTFLFLDGSHELLTRRMKERTGHFMPPSLLDSQLATLQRPTADENFIRLDLDGDIEAQFQAFVAMLAQDSG
jgi:gluconokinase